MVGAYEGHHGRQFRRQPRHHSAHRDVPSGGGTCKIERGSRSDSYSCSIRFRFDSRKKGFCKRLFVKKFCPDHIPFARNWTNRADVLWVLLRWSHAATSFRSPAISVSSCFISASISANGRGEMYL